MAWNKVLYLDKVLFYGTIAGGHFQFVTVFQVRSFHTVNKNHFSCSL